LISCPAIAPNAGFFWEAKHAAKKPLYFIQKRYIKIKLLKILKI
jgi:hypothetical protein